jgi:hypothetical protein
LVGGGNWEEKEWRKGKGSVVWGLEATSAMQFREPLMWWGVKGAACASLRRTVRALRRRAAAGLEDLSLDAQETAAVLSIHMLVL